jgi:5'-nucleotidase
MGKNPRALPESARRKEPAMRLSSAPSRQAGRFSCVPAAVLFVLVLVLAAAPAARSGQPAAQPAQPGQSDFALTILHTNDVHAHISEFDAAGQRCTPEKKAQGKCLGGAARLAAAVKKAREGGGDALFLDAGDWFQGDLAYARFKDEALRDVTARLGYQAMAPGNHEFDDGPAVLARFLSGVPFPMVACNLDAAAEPALAGKIAPYVVLDVGGRLVGVAGVANEDTPSLSSPGANVRFSPAEAPLRAAVAELAARGVNIVVALSHAGFERDKALAATVAGLDVIVGGHSHVLLANGAPDAVGPYPVRISGPGGDTACVVTAGYWGKYLGRLDLRFDAAGRVLDAMGDVQPMDASVDQDPEMAALVATYEERLVPFLATTVGELAVEMPMSKAECRGGECLLGDMAAEAMLFAAARYEAQAAIVNGGSIRAGLTAGKTSLADVITAFPFGNTLVVCDLLGADLLSALEHGVSAAHDPNGSGTGRFPQAAGIRYVFDPSREAGSRLISAQIRGADGKFAAVDPAATYRVAISDYLARGGDGYTMLKDRAKNVALDGRTMDEMVTAYLSAHSPLTLELDGRVERKEAGK